MNNLKSLQTVLEKLMSGLNFAATLNCIDLGHATNKADLWISKRLNNIFRIENIAFENNRRINCENYHQILASM